MALFVCGMSEGLLLQANLGNSPWTILSQGIALHTSLSVGMATFSISAAVLLMWLVLRIKLGLNTVLNAIMVAISIDITRTYVPPPTEYWQQIAFVVLGISLSAIGGAVYLAANMGAGPRDGVMVTLSMRYGWSVKTTRSCLEIGACLSGWLLGGTVGLGTLMFAFLIGPVFAGVLNVLRRLFHNNPQAMLEKAESTKSVL